MSKRRTKRFMACLLAGVLAAGTVTCTAFADYAAPESGMDADENYITGVNCAASAALLDILGVCLVSSDGGGTGSAALGIFGSDINDVPDPYLYNYNYNVSTYGGGGNYDNDSYSTWTATPYTLYWSSNKSGPQGQASGSTTITINGVEKICNPAFYYEPDILIGGESGYATELASYQSTYNADYDPVIISHVSSSNERSDGLGLEYNMFDMCEGFVAIGEAVNEIAEETGKYTRYEESAYEIATNYDKYNRGLYYYAQSAFESGELTEIRYVTGLAYDSDTELWTISQETGRSAQYASGIGADIFEVMGDSYTLSDGTVITPQTVTVSSSGPGGTTVTSEEEAYQLTTSQLIEVLTVTDEEGNEYPGVIVGSAGTDTVYEQLADAGISFISNLPSCIYGLNANAIENGLGLAFYLSFFYYDQNEELNPVSVMGYWIEHFYHVTDTDAMQTVVSNMLSSADLNSAYTGGEELDINEYNETAIEEMIVAGIDYYQDTVEPALDAAGTDSSSMLYWSTLDTTVGIGSDSTDDSTDTHTHTYETVVTDPTCTTSGYTTYTCVDGDDTYVDDITDPTGHSYGEGVVTAATCTAGGYTTYTCTVCGVSYVSDITEATGHTWDSGVVTAPTETEQGYTTYTCTVCGTTKVTDYTAATGTTVEETTEEQQETEEPTEEVTTAQKQTITVKKTVTKTFKVKKLASKKKTFKIKATTSGNGKITFTKKSGSKKLTINKKGKVTVKKGTKAGTYKMKVTVKAAKTATYQAATKTITVKVTVK